MTGLWNVFAANAEADPAAPALILGDAVCSFEELKALAERCSAALAARGVTHGDVIALQLPKRRIAYALLLACLRLGAPYVFLDPKNPPERTARTLARLQPKVLFSEIGTANPFGEALSADGDAWLAGAAARARNTTFPAVTGTDPAYIMFTSGSTGEPKGAVIPHQGVLSLMKWARHMLGDPARARFTGINPLHFDNSVFDIYCGLLNGAALVPIETSEITNPASWVKAIRTARATVMFAVPTLFLILEQLNLLTPKSLPDIRTLPVRRGRISDRETARISRPLRRIGAAHQCLWSDRNQLHLFQHRDHARDLGRSRQRIPAAGRNAPRLQLLDPRRRARSSANGTARGIMDRRSLRRIGLLREP